MVAVPGDFPVTTPVRLTVATAALDVAQVVVLVTTCVEPSLKVAVATSGVVSPVATLGFAGVMATDTGTAGPTVTKTLEFTAPIAAVMVAEPTAFEVTRPVPLTVAALAFEVVQVAVLETFCVLPSVKAAMAVSCCVCPAARTGASGEMLMDTGAAAVTVTGTADVTEPRVALTLAEPCACVVMSPRLLTVAAAEFDVVQVAVAVTFCVLPSVYVAVAESCWVWPSARDTVDGVIAMETGVAAVTVILIGVITAPTLAVMVSDPAVFEVMRPVLLTVATRGFEVDHVAVLVTFCVVPLVSVAVAVICCVWPAARETSEGVRAMETTVAGVTVMLLVAVREPSVAVMVAEPVVTVVTSPEVLTVATVRLELVQRTEVETFCVLPSV